jgi:hypothetical protein
MFLLLRPSEQGQVIGGEHKCLRNGEYCAHRYPSQYRRYGFSCTKTDDRGDYHLT